MTFLLRDFVEKSAQIVRSVLVVELMPYAMLEIRRHLIPNAGGILLIANIAYREEKKR